MLAKRIIPCLDVDGGRVVKGYISPISRMRPPYGSLLYYGVYG